MITYILFIIVLLFQNGAGFGVKLTQFHLVELFYFGEKLNFTLELPTVDVEVTNFSVVHLCHVLS